MKLQFKIMGVIALFIILCSLTFWNYHQVKINEWNYWVNMVQIAGQEGSNEKVVLQMLGKPTYIEAVSNKPITGFSPTPLPPPKAELIRARKEFIVPMLQALKLLLDSGVPGEEGMQKNPGGFLFDCPPDDPHYQEFANKNKEANIAHDRAILINDLISDRSKTIDNIIGAYLMPPYDVDELKQIATDVLKNDNMVNEMVAKTRDMIATRNK